MNLKFVFRVVLFLSFPFCAWADGIKISEYGLEGVRIALLVKILLLDAKNSTVQVQVLKKFSRFQPSQAENLAFQNGSESIPLSEVKIDQKLNLQTLRRTETVANRWVRENRYWGSTRQVANGEKVFMVYSPLEGQFEFVKFSDEAEKKFELSFNEKSSELLKAMSEADLSRLMQDRDLESSVVAELSRRKKIDAAFLFKIQDPGALGRMTSLVMKSLPKAEQQTQWLELARLAGKADEETQRRYLILFRNFQFHEIETSIRFYAGFNQSYKEVRYETGIFMYELAALSKKGDESWRSAFAPTYLEFLKFSNSDQGQLRLADFFRTLSAQERPRFLEQTAELAVAYAKKESYLGTYAVILEEMSKENNLKVAWMLSALPFKDLRGGAGSAAFNQVLSVIFKEDRVTDIEVKNKILNFTAPYLADTSEPIDLLPEIKEKYLKLGGLVYKDLPVLYLVHQKNNAELAPKFLTYFEKAYDVEILEMREVTNRSRLRMKVVKVWGQFKIPKNSPDQNVNKIDSLAIEGAVLDLAVTNQSVELLNSLKLKELILATSGHDYKFLIFEKSWRPQIIEAFAAKK